MLGTPTDTHDTPMRYKTIRELGRGGMGVTFLADTPTGEQVVLKRLKLERLDNWKALELFEREARVLKALNHPGIPSYIDSIEDQGSGTFTLVQSLAAGKNLRHWVDEGWRPTEQDVIAIAEQVLDVLVYLQGLNPPVVHRDIKPSNLVRTKDGEIAVVDFGAVRDAYEETITGGSTIVGTFGYMAPEQLRGNADHTSDLYGLGATLLFCLTHQEPNDLPQQRMRYVFKDLTQLSSGLESWIAKLVEPHPEDRFLDASRALDALLRLSSSALSDDPSGVPAHSKPLRGATFPDTVRTNSGAQWPAHPRSPRLTCCGRAKGWHDADPPQAPPPSSLNHSARCQHRLAWLRDGLDGPRRVRIGPIRAFRHWLLGSGPSGTSQCGSRHLRRRVS